MGRGDDAVSSRGAVASSASWWLLGGASPEPSASQSARSALNPGYLSKITRQPMGDVFIYLNISVYFKSTLLF